jgi:hypothetical protein
LELCINVQTTNLTASRCRIKQTKQKLGVLEDIDPQTTEVLPVPDEDSNQSINQTNKQTNKQSCELWVF